MMTAADTMKRARPLLAGMVDMIERQTGSRMVAYDRVASWVGLSASKVRKVIGRSHDVCLEFHEVMNILMTFDGRGYAELCEFIDAKADEERAKAAELRGMANETLQGAAGALAGGAGAPER